MEDVLLILSLLPAWVFSQVKYNSAINLLILFFAMTFSRP